MRNKWGTPRLFFCPLHAISYCEIFAKLLQYCILLQLIKNIFSFISHGNFQRSLFFYYLFRRGFRLPQRSHLRTLKSFVSEKSGKHWIKSGNWKILRWFIFFLYPYLHWNKMFTLNHWHLFYKKLIKMKKIQLIPPLFLKLYKMTIISQLNLRLSRRILIFNSVIPNDRML